MSYSLQKHLSYNLWATGKLAEFIAKADENIFDTEVKSSFTSLRKTVYHIWDAEYIWMQRLQGNSLLDWPSNNFSGNREATLKAWTENSKTLLDFISAKDEEYGNWIISYKNMKGDSFENSVEGIIMHVVNHGTFHRGQLVTILRELGYSDFTSTDLITFLRL